MRTSPQLLPKSVAASHPVERQTLDELLKTLVVMRWDLNNALHEAADAPRVVTDRLKLLRRELDASIAALKEAVQKRGLRRESATFDS